MVEPFELLRDLSLRTKVRWSPTAKCSCGLRAPALLPERLALDSLEGASLDLALSLADRRVAARSRRQEPRAGNCSPARRHSYGCADQCRGERKQPGGR